MSVYDKVRLLDKHKCRAWGCGTTCNLESHHIIPRSQGGENEEYNLITLCEKHHKLVTEGKMSDTEMLKKIIRKRDFRWGLALNWHIQRDKLKEIKRGNT